jgi:putative YhbY family RNA-binding protein
MLAHPGFAGSCPRHPLKYPFSKGYKMRTLSSEQRRQLRARAHSLSPVAAIAREGLSASVIKEIDVCLKAHELIKIRVYHDDRQVREDYLSTLCATLEAAPVQHIGKILVIWRPRPEEKSQAANAKHAPKAAYRAKRHYQ